MHQHNPAAALPALNTQTSAKGYDFQILLLNALAYIIHIMNDCGTGYKKNIRQLLQGYMLPRIRYQIQNHMHAFLLAQLEGIKIILSQQHANGIGILLQLNHAMLTKLNRLLLVFQKKIRDSLQIIANRSFRYLEFVHQIIDGTGFLIIPLFHYPENDFSCTFIH